MSILDNIPLELIFTIISYLNDNDIQQFIESSDYLKRLFSDDEIWKKLFYQNVLTNFKWKDIYLGVNYPSIKYQQDWVGLTNYYFDYLIIHTGYVNDLSNERLIELNRRIANYNSSRLSLIISHPENNYNESIIIYKSVEDQNISDDLLKADLYDVV